MIIFRSSTTTTTNRTAVHITLPGPAVARTRSASARKGKNLLIKERCIASGLVDRLIESGVVYADARANAVFVHFDFESQARAVAVGAELRGTAPPLARHGSRLPQRRRLLRNFGELGEQPPAPVSERNVVLCESAIDAISCLIIFPGATCISTAGVRGNPAWLAGLLERGGTVYCGFDNDEAGDEMARAMIAAHPEIGRLRPVGARLERHAGILCQTQSIVL